MDRDFLSYVKPYQLRKRPHKLFGWPASPCSRWAHFTA